MKLCLNRLAIANHNFSMRNSWIAIPVGLALILPLVSMASDKNRLRTTGRPSNYKSLPILGRDSTTPLVEPAPEAPAETLAEKNVRIMTGLRDLSVRGSVDMYYLNNFNRPAPLKAVPTSASPSTQNTYRVFDTSHDSMQLSYAHLYVQKQAGSVTGTVDLAYGPAMQSFAGTATDVSQVNIKQAVLGYRADNGLVFEAGRFVTHVGLETIEANENWNYSRGLLFGYFDPFWHQGVKISYPFGDSVSATVLVVNGWNNSYDFNSNKNVGGQINWLATDSLSFAFNYLTGQEPSTPVQAGGERKSIIDVVASYKASDVLSFVLNADQLTYAAPAGGQTALGLALYVRYEFLENWALSPRFEIVDDKDNLAIGAAFPGGQSLTSFTVTLENKLTPNLAWRLEVRVDKSTKEPFTKDVSTTSNQETATVALLGSF